MNNRNKIILNNSGYAYIETPAGRFVIDADLDPAYNGVYISFQPKPIKEGIVPDEQQLVYIEDITDRTGTDKPTMSIKVWADENNEDYTESITVPINNDIIKSALARD